MPTATSGFIKDLKSIDKDLSVKWIDKIKRFVIFHKDNKRKIYPVMRIQYQNGSFKSLDRRAIDALRYSNHLRHKKPQDILYIIDKENEETELKNQRKLSSDIESITKDNWRQMMDVPVI